MAKSGGWLISDYDIKLCAEHLAAVANVPVHRIGYIGVTHRGQIKYTVEGEAEPRLAYATKKLARRLQAAGLAPRQVRSVADALCEPRLRRYLLEHREELEARLKGQFPFPEPELLWNGISCMVSWNGFRAALSLGNATPLPAELPEGFLAELARQQVDTAAKRALARLQQRYLEKVFLWEVFDRLAKAAEGRLPAGSAVAIQHGEWPEKSELKNGELIATKETTGGYGLEAAELTIESPCGALSHRVGFSLPPQPFLWAKTPKNGEAFTVEDIENRKALEESLAYEFSERVFRGSCERAVSQEELPEPYQGEFLRCLQAAKRVPDWFFQLEVHQGLILTYQLQAGAARLSTPFFLVEWQDGEALVTATPLGEGLQALERDPALAARLSYAEERFRAAGLLPLRRSGLGIGFGDSRLSFHYKGRLYGAAFSYAEELAAWREKLEELIRGVVGYDEAEAREKHERLAKYWGNSLARTILRIASRGGSCTIGALAARLRGIAPVPERERLPGDGAFSLLSPEDIEAFCEGLREAGLLSFKTRRGGFRSIHITPEGEEQLRAQREAGFSECFDDFAFPPEVEALRQREEKAFGDYIDLLAPSIPLTARCLALRELCALFAGAPREIGTLLTMKRSLEPEGPQRRFLGELLKALQGKGPRGGKR